jgi:hypothetical protein
MAKKYRTPAQIKRAQEKAAKMQAAMNETPATTIRIGHSGETYNASVEVSAGSILVSRKDEDGKNFPVRITLTQQDAVKLLMGLSKRMSLWTHDPRWL